MKVAVHETSFFDGGHLLRVKNLTVCQNVPTGLRMTTDGCKPQKAAMIKPVPWAEQTKVVS